MSETFGPGQHNPSIPALGAPNPEEIAADVLSTIQDSAAEEVAAGAAKMVIVTINDKAADQANVVREYADAPDGIKYPMINSAVRPAPGDKVVAIERQGGMVVLGKAWAPGDPDLDTVRSGADLLDNAVTGRIVAPDSIGSDELETGAADNAALGFESVSGSKIQPGVVTPSKLDRGYATDGHGHGTHWHGTQSIGGHSHSVADIGSHSHTYGYYNGSTWETATWRTANTSSHGGWTIPNTGSGGGHDHGGTDTSGV